MAGRDLSQVLTVEWRFGDDPPRTGFLSISPLPGGRFIFEFRCTDGLIYRYQVVFGMGKNTMEEVNPGVVRYSIEWKGTVYDMSDEKKRVKLFSMNATQDQRVNYD